MFTLTAEPLSVPTLTRPRLLSVIDRSPRVDPEIDAALVETPILPVSDVTLSVFAVMEVPALLVMSPPFETASFTELPLKLLSVTEPPAIRSKVAFAEDVVPIVTASASDTNTFAPAEFAIVVSVSAAVLMRLPEVPILPPEVSVTVGPEIKPAIFVRLIFAPAPVVDKATEVIPETGPAMFIPVLDVVRLIATTSPLTELSDTVVAEESEIVTSPKVDAVIEVASVRIGAFGPAAEPMLPLPELSVSALVLITSVAPLRVIVPAPMAVRLTLFARVPAPPIPRIMPSLRIAPA